MKLLDVIFTKLGLCILCRLYETHNSWAFQQTLKMLCKHTHTCSNGLVSTWLSFTKSYGCESPRKSLHSCNELSLIQRKNQHNNGHQRLDFKNWFLKISNNAHEPLLLIKGEIIKKSQWHSIKMCMLPLP